MSRTTQQQAGPGETLVEFGPLESRGVLLGVSVPSLTTAALGTALALAALFGLPGTLGLLTALAVLALAGVAGFVPVAGAPGAEWAAVLTGYAARAVTGRRGWRSGTPTAGTLPDGTPAVVDLPAALRRARTRLVPVPRVDGTVGVLLDGGLAVGVLRARAGSAFLLKAPADQAADTAAWAEVIGGIADPGSPWVRLQWLDSTAPVDAGALVAFLADAATPAARTPGTPEHQARAGYERLLHAAAPVSERHDILIAAALDPRRVDRQIRDTQRDLKAGRSARDAAVGAVLVRHLEQLAYTLASAGVVVDGALSARQLAQVLLEHADPGERAEQSALAAQAAGPAGTDSDSAGQIGGNADPPDPSEPHAERVAGERGGVGPGGVWPLAVEESFGGVRTDGGWHATLWVREWPRRPARLDFLAPLLLRTGAITRTVAVTMAPVDGAAALRQAEATATADESDEALRGRFGVRTAGRHRRDAAAAGRREEELLDGWDDVRFSGYLTVTAATEAELEDAVAEVQAQARAARLRLVRLVGQQADAFWFTAPLCRGLR